MFADRPLHGLRDRMLALRSLPAFAGMADESALHMIESSRERRFRAGDALFTAATPLESIYFVINGDVSVSHNGKQFSSSRRTGAIGVTAALSNIRTGWHGVAERDTLALELPSEIFRANLEEDFTLLRNTLRIISAMALESRGNLPAKPQPQGELGEYPTRDLTLVERVLELRGSPGPFANANMEATIDMCRLMETIHVEPGHLLFDLGEPSAYSLRISYGRVRCTVATGEHVDVGAGMVLGVLDAWSSQPRSYSARAETAAVVTRTSNEDALSVLEMHPTVAFRMLVGLATSLVPA